VNASARRASARGAPVRRALLRAAVELVGELGWNAVSTRAVAERARVTPGLVHYHFRSVQALLREAVLGVLRESLTGVRPVLQSAATAEDGVRALFGMLEGYTGHDPESLAIMECYLAATRDEGLHRELVHLLGEFRREVAAWLAGHGHDRPEDTAAVLAATIDGVVLHRALKPDLTADLVAGVLRPLLAPRSPGRM
jgi:AcrR family transcriptional regulator